MSGPGFGGMGQFGGAFLLINALSSKIYELIAESTQTIVRGYEQGGVVGLIRSTELRALVRRYLWLLCVAFAFERLRWLWSIANSFVSLKQCEFRIAIYLKTIHALIQLTRSNLRSLY